MTNFLLDPLPDEYEGYLIRTDFRIGIQMRLAFEDNDLTTEEKAMVAINLLFGNGAPEDIEKALNGVLWFLKAGDDREADGNGDTRNSGDYEAQNDDGDDSGGEQSNFSFDYDAMRIYTAFKRTYGVDLTTARLHWFEFVAMLQDLGECAFTSIVEIRAKDLGKVPKAQQGEYARLKERYALPQTFTEEEEAKINAFFDLLPK